MFDYEEPKNTLDEGMDIIEDDLRDIAILTAEMISLCGEGDTGKLGIKASKVEDLIVNIKETLAGGFKADTTSPDGFSSYGDFVQWRQR